MEAFLKFLYQVLKTFFLGIYHMISSGFIGLFEIVNVKTYIDAFEDYSKDFNVIGWILSILVILVLACLIVLLGFLVYLLVRKLIRIFKNSHNEEALLFEIGKLNKEIYKLSKEKDRILQLQTGGIVEYDLEGNLAEDSNITNTLSDNASSSDIRFFKLNSVDEKYKLLDLENINYNNKISLNKLCEKFRLYCSGNLKLYYDIKTIRLFISGLGVTRLIILQGISGTGKTSLPYAFGKFIENPALITSVQPSWRDKSELLGYFNEFTKKFNETEMLKNLYDASYNDSIYLNVLDEMNISRVEYYFAEMLSILEMPSKDDWIIDIIPNVWENDPKNFENGKFKIPGNVWFIGTANNDDSTFAIADKVYDRAIPITINTKGTKFNAPLTENVNISNSYLESLYEKAKADNKVSSETLEKLEELDNYLIEHFRISFGNRILKQICDFVPIYVSCGGKEIEAIDYLICFKILRKFEMQNLSFIREELDGFNNYLNTLFGEGEMEECLKYINLLNNKK